MERILGVGSLLSSLLLREVSSFNNSAAQLWLVMIMNTAGVGHNIKSVGGTFTLFYLISAEVS